MSAHSSHSGYPVKNNQLSAGINSLQAALKHPPERHRPTAGGEVSTKDAVCEEWVQLVRQYQAAVKAYSDATAELSSLPGAEFNRAWMRAESLRELSKSFRAALFEHEHEHDCSVVHAHYGSPERI